MWIRQNPNPLAAHTGDCVVRAISIVLDQSWEKTYLELCAQGLLLADMPNANHVWGAYLKAKGFVRDTIPNECPDCYTVRDFVKDHNHGNFILGTGSHVVAVVEGHYVDDWDSGDEVPVIVFTRKQGG